MVEKNKKIIQAILDWNPWITEKFPQEFLGYKREIDILQYLDQKEIKILEGPRRAGKSTLLYRVLHHLWEKEKKILYLNFDDPVLQKYSLEEVFNIFLERQDVDYLFVDEIQNCSDWVPFVRKKYDTRTLKQIWITGSNSNLIKQEYATLLTGRNIKLKIFPLNFREFLLFKEFKYNLNLLSKKQEIQIRRFFQEFLEHGAFPEVVLKKVGKKELLINYYEDFLYKDIITRYQSNPEKLKELSIFLNSNTTKLISYRNLSRVLNLNYSTTTKYITHFLEVYLFFVLYRFDYSLKKQISIDKKIFALDTGLANAVSFKFSEDYGRQLENIVFLELKKKNKNIFYQKNGTECDFVVFDKNKVVEVIQVSKTLENEKTKEREVNGLLEVMEKFKLKKGIILTDNEEDEFQKNGRKIKIIPVWKWLLEK